MDVEHRLKRLELQNRTTRVVGILAVASFATVFLMAQAKEKKLPDLQVRSLVMRDDRGRVVAKLSHEDGATLFVLRDAAGLDRAALSVRPDGYPGLSFRDALGEVRVRIGQRTDAAPVVWLGSGERDDASLELLLDSGLPTFRLRDERGDWRAALQLSRSGSAGLAFRDAAARTRVLLTPDALTLSDSKGTVRWRTGR